MVDAGFTPSYPGSGTSLKDLVDSNDGTLTNGPTFDSGNGGSIVFDGTNDYITIPTSNLISGWSQLTYNVWVNVSQISTTYWPGFISTYTTSISRNISIGQWNNTQKFWYEIDTTNGNFFGSGPGNVIFSLNEWFNVCMVYDGSNVYGYYNSTLDKSFSASGNLQTINSLNIGCHDPGTAGGFFNGKISISQIYNKALSSTEITQNYNAQKGRFGIT